MRELRKSNDRKLFGVAAGCAEYFGGDKTLWRVGWAVGAMCFPPLALAYLILGLVLPSEPYAYGPGQQGYSQQPFPQQPYGQPGFGGQPHEGQQQAYTAPPPRPAKRLTKSRDRWLSGVAAGLAEYLDLDPALVRLLFLASLFMGGAGLLVYIVLTILMPNPEYSYQGYPPR